MSILKKKVGLVQQWNCFFKMKKKSTFNIAPSIYNAYNICPRQAWLMLHQVSADQDNSYIDIGKLIDETSFKREKKQIYIPDLNANIDMVVKRNGTILIAEIKKSSKTLNSGILQLKYYLYLLETKQIFVKGIIKIPVEKKSIDIELTVADREYINDTIKKIKTLLKQAKAPLPVRKRICSKCGFFEFCWA